MGEETMDGLEQRIDRLQSAFSVVMRKLATEFTEDEEIGLTGPQFFILRYLTNKGRCTVSELANVMHVKPSAITVMVERLHKHKYVIRSRDGIDRRVVFIEITDMGNKKLAKADQKRKQILAKYLMHLKQEELDQLITIFEKLSQIVTSNQN